MNKSKSITKIAFILLLTALFFGISFNLLGGGYSKKTIDKTGSYLTSFGGMTGIIQLGGEQLKVTQALTLGENPTETNQIIFNRDYFATDVPYNYDVRLKNTEKVGGANSKYLRWKWTAIIDGVEENVSKYFLTTDNSATTDTLAYLMDDGYIYLVDKNYKATKLTPQEDVKILEKLQFFGEFNYDTREYGSVLDKYYSGSHIQIFLTIQGSTDNTESSGVPDDDAWEIVAPESIIYDSYGNVLGTTTETTDYTIPADLAVAPSKTTSNGDTIYFQGWSINGTGTVIEPGETVNIPAGATITPVYGVDEERTDVVLQLDESTGTYAISGAGNTSITSVKIPALSQGQPVTVIQDMAFYEYTSLQTVDSNSTITTIGTGAFMNCYALQEVELPDTLTSIGDGAFAYCISLQEVNIPASVESIGMLAFGGTMSCTAYNVDDDNLNYCDVDGVLYDKNQNVIYAYPPAKQAETYTIPNTVVAIGPGAFGTAQIGEVIIPDSVFAIYDMAFLQSYITTVTIPNSVTSISTQAFSGCTNLKEVTIPDSVTGIGNQAFAGCTSLKYVEINSNDIISSTYGESQFESCTALEEVVINCSVITTGMFAGCSSLNKVSIGDNCISFSYKSFASCVSLTQITIPLLVDWIDHECFTNCTSLKNVTFKNKVAWIVDYTVISETDLADTTLAARYLTQDYVDYYWSRSDR